MHYESGMLQAYGDTQNTNHLSSGYILIGLLSIQFREDQGNGIQWAWEHHSQNIPDESGPTRKDHNLNRSKRKF